MPLCPIDSSLFRLSVQLLATWQFSVPCSCKTFAKIRHVRPEFDVKDPESVPVRSAGETQPASSLNAVFPASVYPNGLDRTGWNLDNFPYHALVKHLRKSAMFARNSTSKTTERSASETQPASFLNAAFPAFIHPKWLIELDEWNLGNFPYHALVKHSRKKKRATQSDFSIPDKNRRVIVTRRGAHRRRSWNLIGRRLFPKPRRPSLTRCYHFRNAFRNGGTFGIFRTALS